ncbi:MAG: hypothetical protein A4S09_05490 [Proteobacteria bacterium SG_bin7]|nr:MAG: hypothetical protein A4S09_05490 [Proteobacteria bacterium SG_bin7]
MKKLIFVAALVSFSNFANAKIGTAGCGLGNIVFGSKPGLIQVVAATLNLTGFQTIGMTAGTSNCGDGIMSAQLDNYVEVNQIALANDVSRGNGETIDGLAKLLGCQNGSSVNQTLKQNYEVIFPNTEVKPKQVSRTIREVLKNSSVSCSHLG